MSRPLLAAVSVACFCLPLARAGWPLDGLGLADGATEIDYQVAYKSILTDTYKQRDTNDTALDRLISAQMAYEDLSDHHMREEALSFIDYWSEVEYLSSDEELRRFTELQVGGSARLRVIFVASRTDAKIFEAFAVAVRLYGRVKVAQLCHQNMFDVRGAMGKFYQTLKVHSGGVILFDPLSRASRITYELNGIGNDIDRVLGGDSGTSKLARVQELDARSYKARCGEDGPGHEEMNYNRCRWNLVVATGNEYETRRTDVATLMKEFSDACKALQVMEKYPWLACFWLHLDRAPQWVDEIQKFAKDPHDAGRPRVFMWRRFPGGIEVALHKEALPDRTMSYQLTTPEQARWSTFDGVAYYSVGLCRFTEATLSKQEAQPFLPVPALPRPIRRDEEPRETMMEKANRFYQNAVECASNQECMIGVVELGLLHAGVVTPDSTEAERKTMLVGTGIAALMFVLFFGRRCCCCCPRRSAGKDMNEQNVLRNMQLLIQIPLNRKSKDEKYGMGIEPHPDGGLLVNAVAPDGLVGRWNQTQLREVNKVKSGDRIISVKRTVNGNQVTLTDKTEMQKAFREDDLLLTIAADRGESEVVKVASTLTVDEASCVAKGFSFKQLAIAKDAELLEVPNSNAGMQVMKIGPQIQEWNAKAARDQTCISQKVEVGDRVFISPANHVLNCKLRFPNQVATDTFDLVVQKTGPDDSLGIQIRSSPVSPEYMEVLDVLDRAVQRACNQAGNRQVLRGDRLVSANGKRGAEMNAEFKAEQVTLRFERWVEAAGDNSVASNAAPFQPMRSPLGVTAPGGAVPPTPIGGAAPPPGVGAPFGAPAPVPQPMQNQFAPAVTLQPPVQPSSHGQPASSTAMPPVPAVPTPPAPPKPPAKPPTKAAGQSASVELAPLAGKLFVGLLIIGVVVWGAVFGRKPPQALQIWAARQGRLGPKPMPYGARRFLAMIKPELYGDIGFILLFIGALLTVQFLVYEITMLARCHERRMLSQLCIAYLASNFLGFGMFFMFVWAGVYQN